MREVQGRSGGGSAGRSRSSATVLSARQAALAARRRGRVERAAAERRRSEGVLEVLVNVSRRAEAEVAAGVGVRRLMLDEGMTAREIVQWCGGELDQREVLRLRRMGDDAAAVDVEEERRGDGRDQLPG